MSSDEEGVTLHIEALDREAAGIGEDVLDPVGAKLFIEVCYEIAKAANEAGWDQPHQLLIVRGVRERFDAHQIGLEGELFGVEISAVPSFYPLYGAIEKLGGRMHHAIAEVAKGWREVMPPEISEHVLGVALVYEGWIGEDEGQERAEARLINASGRNGLRVGYSQPRDGVPRHLVAQAFAGQHCSMAGDIPNSLHYLMEVIEGLTTESFNEWQTKYAYWEETRD